jgi:hypothetical protein
LRSEIRRAYAVIGVIVLVFVLVIMGKSRHDLDDRIRLAAGIGLGVLLAVQLGVLALARWAGLRQRNMPTWFVVLTVIIESLIPTGIMLSNIVPGALPPYVSLSSPPILAYGLLTGLMTLRLRPALCILPGTLGALSYAGLFLYVSYRMHLMQPSAGLPRVAYINSALLIFICHKICRWRSSRTWPSGRRNRSRWRTATCRRWSPTASSNGRDRTNRGSMRNLASSACAIRCAGTPACRRRT